ncbi:AAA family ATPase [Longispora sp. NPDC051575]|uniref:AAA family ATPase n=1 Tax=Longispora sp. NPDC051575 TaxID=3154943 RepID=UPI00341211BA
MTKALIQPLLLPYSMIVGQDDLKTALEVAFVNPMVGGVLATGQRGTAKSTTVRSFAMMAAGELPVTLPIGATDDRVLGGWNVDKLMQGESTWQPGLLVEASTSDGRTLYVDEINLLDDYLVNIILDVASTGILNLQRENHSEENQIRFTLVGTMNPDEGGLRPQLLDRFGLVVPISALEDLDERGRIVEAVLCLEEQAESPGTESAAHVRVRKACALDSTRRDQLTAARDTLPAVVPGKAALVACVKLASEFEVAGHRGEIVLIQAARALAALEGQLQVGAEHIRKISKLALVHRRPGGESGTLPEWTDEHDALVNRIVDACDW